MTFDKLESETALTIGVVAAIVTAPVWAPFALTYGLLAYPAWIGFCLIAPNKTVERFTKFLSGFGR